jgi:4-amino-4-deoxy-L-arabinose transferase-like glycosyltransferase
MSATAEEARLRGVERSRLRAVVRGRAGDPAWVRPALFGLLGGTALLYLAGLGASGWANSFYSAAVQAGATSWKAFFFGSFDASSFITVDKPPASLWVMDISARLFGVNSWSILVPQALEGVAAVGLLYATVRRRFSPAAGLLAGAVLALTPVAALMFRFDNPDALLTLLLVASAYALTRSLERASATWLALAGALIGLGFLAKMLQAFLVVPAFALVYLVAAPATLWRRFLHVLVSGAAMVAAAGWWVAIVALWPASSRPYIGGSQSNSILELIFGYNGLGRITGNERGSVVGGQVFGGGQGGGMWGPTGLFRLFGAEMGTQISWLLPAALIFLVALLAAMRHAGRTDGRRAGVLLWGSWLVVTGLVFSYMRGIVHPYYNVVLAPPIGALVGVGVCWAWQQRNAAAARLTLAGAIGATVVWSFVLLDRTPAWLPWLRFLVLFAGIAAASLVAAGPRMWRGDRLAGRLVLGLALTALLAAPAAYAVDTSSNAHTGAIPSAGPAGSVGFRGPGGGRRPFAGSPALGRGAPPFAGGPGPGAFGAGAPRGFGGAGAPGGAVGAPGGGFGRGGLGGLLDAGAPSSTLVSLLRQDASSYRWVAAVVGANSAAGVQLATGKPVMAIGGFNGTDPAPTLAEFEAYVRSGRIHYFVGTGGGVGGGGLGGSSSTNAIAAWVAQNFGATTVGGVTVYDLANAR